MKFQTVEDLLNFINTAELNVSDYQFVMEAKSICEDSCTLDFTAETDKDSLVLIDFPSGKKEYKAKLGETNTLYVESFKATPNFCGSGSFIFDGKNIQCNMCEQDGITEVNLALEIDGALQHRTFKLFYIHEMVDDKLIVLGYDK